MARATHPTPQELAGFVRGTLADADFAAVEEHLLVCDACVRSLEEPPEDALLRLARQSATAFGPATHAGAENGTVPPPPRAPGGDDIPALLAGHTRYRVLRLLGQGGMGAVYLAEHRVMRRLVALKVIKPMYTADPALVERFRREVHVAAQLQHPNLVTAYDADQAGDAHFLVMEYVAGVSLGQRLKERGPLPVAEACAYARQVALALQHAHERGLVHRDIKPDNLMLTGDGCVKVLDFGLAALTAEPGANPLTSADALLGTPDYLAPEQAEDARTADTRADVYSLGCTLYHLLAGQIPYPESTNLRKILAHREKPLPAVRALRPEVSPELEAVLARMLAKRPEDRYQTPGAAAAALAEVATAAPARRPRRRRLLAVLLALVATLAAVAVYAITLRRGDVPSITRQPGGARDALAALRRRLPESGPQQPLALHWGCNCLKLSDRECLRRAVAALGRQEGFILAETVGNAVFAHNEKTAVVVFPAPSRDGICVCVVAAGRDKMETGRLWPALLKSICDGPSPDNVPDWIATANPNRQSRAPILHMLFQPCRLTLMEFTDPAVTALRRQGFEVLVEGRLRDTVIGYKHDIVAAVMYDTLPDGSSYVAVVTGAIDALEAERLCQEIQADILAGRLGRGPQ
jgi:hypothetical protein